MPTFELDHSKYTNEYLKAGINVYTNEDCIKQMGIKSHRLKPIQNLVQFELGPWKTLPYDVRHDIATFGFLLYHVPTKNKTVFFTDTFYISHVFSGLNNIIGEINFSNEILEQKRSSGTLHNALRDRVLSSHMELTVFQDFLKANDLSKVNNICLVHLSNSNSDEKLFRRTIEEQTGKNVTVLTNGVELDLSVTPF